MNKTVIACLASSLVLALLSCEELSTQVSDSRFTVTIDVVSPFVAEGNYLKNDVVQLEATVTEDGRAVSTSGQRFRSSDQSVVEILNSSSGQARFADVGTAQLTVTFSEPALAGADSLSASLNVRVTEYQVELSLRSTVSGTDVAPVLAPLGDTVRVLAVVRKDGQEVASSGVTIESSSDTSVVDPAAASAADEAALEGEGFANLTVSIGEPDIPGNEPLRATLAITVQELFTGLFSKTTGRFGNSAAGDTVIVEASQMHGFTDSTWVEFPNRTIGFVDSVTPDTLVFLVPAGADTGQLVFRNLVDGQGGFRDSVPTQIVFNGPGSAALNDFFEPNDEFPLTVAQKITPPFEALLAVDPTKTAPPDTNFFYLVVEAGQQTVNVRAEWQQDANLDFFICNGDGAADPPTGYTSFCSRPATENSTAKDGLEEDTKTLSAGVHVFAFYCPAAAGQCPALPLTYKVSMEEQ